MAAALPPVVIDNTVTLTWGAAHQYYGYCTLLDVNFEFANSEAYTTLTPNVVGQEITNAAMELQELLDYVYVMPYSGSNGGILLTLRNINAQLATANIIDRYFQGSVPNSSVHAGLIRSQAELILHSILTGEIHWDPPFGDAVAQGQLPIYQQSALAVISPGPNSSSDGSTDPVFVMGRSAYRRDVM